MKRYLELLSQSPFFEAFRPDHLKALAEHARDEIFPADTVFVQEDMPAERFYMLVAGKVQLSFRAQAGPAAAIEAKARVLIRTISEPGRVFGWSTMVEPYHYRDSATTLEETHVLAFQRGWLEAYAQAHPAFGVSLMDQILWVLGNRLREARIRLVASRYEEEILAIRALLDQSAAQLRVTSALHKLPHYLENRLTLSDAFQTLELLKVHGDELERNLAQHCLEILDRVNGELALYQQLQSIYENVANALPGEDPTTIRTRCTEDFNRLYANTNHVIEGLEHLPPEPGQIFIMNHLDNHPDNALPNDFRLTMDTHFVASMIIYRKYGTCPIRVIRKANPSEYGHQKYFDRLGYIYVYAKHVDEDEARPEFLAEERRRHFLEAAGSYLRDGQNILICPEGACTVTERSPLRFRTGAFRLAAYVEPEPLIVPVAVANFDKKITRTRLAAKVFPPFRLSDHVAKPIRDAALFDFINAYQKTFAGYVREAEARAKI